MKVWAENRDHGPQTADYRSMQNPRKIPVKTKAGTFVLEMSADGLYAVRFPKVLSLRVPPTAGRSNLRDRHALRAFLSAGGGLAMTGWLSVLEGKLRGRKLDLTSCTPFQRKVYIALRRVPAGKVITYGELAKRAGYPGAARAVGNAMKKNRLPLVIPCHRVVPSTGGIGEYSQGKRWKKMLLELESVAVSTYHSVKLEKE